MKRLKTHADIAAWQGVSIRSVENWARLPDWSGPPYTRSKLRAFLKKHMLGEFNPKRTPEAKAEAASLREATRQLLIEKGASLAVTNQRLRKRQREELAQLVLVADVERLYQQTREQVMAVVEGIEEKMREALQGEPTEATWQEMRERTLDVVRKVPRELAAAMEQLL